MQTVEYNHHHLNAYTGLFYNNHTKLFYHFFQSFDNVKMSVLDKKTTLEDVLKEHHYPIWLLRHSLGVSGGIEDYTKQLNFIPKNDRERELAFSMTIDGQLKNLEYSGIKIPMDIKAYSHAVGPIHAGIIEPGHFRFSVIGEIIQSLHIRLGFQKRNIINKIIGSNPLSVMSMSEVISGDSTIAYSTAFANIYEQSMGMIISDEVKLIRMILLEVERIAIHIGDMGAIAGDIGFYPLHGVCATDRGIPLGIMEALTGSRFGKGAIFPGEVRLNKRLPEIGLKELSIRIHKVYQNIKKHFTRATRTSTIRERLHSCGNINKIIVQKNGFIGMTARCTGMIQDMRLSESMYQNAKVPLQLDFIDNEHLHGDAWSRFYLRFLEFESSCKWLENVLLEIDISKATKGRLILQDNPKFKSGIFYKSVEGWRGPVLVALDLSNEGIVNDAYIRDPSVLNWHALELAVKDELIGDFPLNNKSFNLSYVGFDL